MVGLYMVNMRYIIWKGSRKWLVGKYFRPISVCTFYYCVYVCVCHLPRRLAMKRYVGYSNYIYSCTYM
jgi:hypothetical protein